jgi:hypothetical protein
MPLADDTAMFFGGTIMSFALPYGAFIVITLALFFLFRARHSGPRLKYLTTDSVTSVLTREPGPVPAPPVPPAAVAGMVTEITEDPETGLPEALGGEARPEPGTTAAPETAESKDGE